MRSNRWHNVPFTISLDLATERGQLVDDSAVPVDCLTVPAGCEEGECVTLELDCESSGYYDPGRTYGLPEDCYPPEGEDERAVVAARLIHPAGLVELAGQTLADLFERFQSRIEAEEVSTERDYDYDDRG